MRSREPAVAGTFYPAEPEVLHQQVTAMLGQEPVQYAAPKAIIVPHAGYVYSGELAAKTLSSVEIPKTVVIIGTNHHGAGLPAALSTGNWNMPLNMHSCSATVVLLQLITFRLRLENPIEIKK